MNFIAIPAIIERIATRKDNTISITIGCNELAPANVGQLMSMHGKLGYVCIKPEAFTKQELDIVDMLKTDESIGKTPAQRLRGVLYRLWQQDNKGYTDFALFYGAELEKIINHYKDKLP